MIKPSEARKITEGILNWKQVEKHIKNAAENGHRTVTLKITDSLRDQLKVLNYTLIESGKVNTYSIQW